MYTWICQCVWLAAFLFAAATGAGAQSTPPASIDLSGTWTLDTYLSDNPEQVAASIRWDLGQGAGELLFPAVPEGGRSGRGAGRRGQNGGSPRTPAAPFSAEEQRQVDDVTTAVRYPPPTLALSQTASSVTFTDAQGRARTFQTNSKREKYTFDSGTADIIASWEGPHLVIAYDLPKARRMTSTYSIVPTTKQLLVRVAFERSPGQPGPFEVKQVYNRAAVTWRCPADRRLESRET